MEYLFNSHRPKKTKKIVALPIKILCAVMSFMAVSLSVNHTLRVRRKPFRELGKAFSLRAGGQIGWEPLSFPAKREICLLQTDSDSGGERGRIETLRPDPTWYKPFLTYSKEPCPR